MSCYILRHGYFERVELPLVHFGLDGLDGGTIDDGLEQDGQDIATLTPWHTQLVNIPFFPSFSSSVLTRLSCPELDFKLAYQRTIITH